MRKVTTVAVALTALMLITLAYAPDASAVAITGGFSVTGSAEWVASAGTTVTLDLAGGFDFVTTAIAIANGNSPGVPGPITVGDVGGSYAGLSGATGTITDFTFNPLKCGGVACAGGLLPTIPPTLVGWETFTLGGITASVDLTSITLVHTVCASGCDQVGSSDALVQGTAILHLTGFDATLGTFQVDVGTIASTFGFTAQVGANPAVPEPATLLLLGSGLVAAGVFARKRR